MKYRVQLNAVFNNTNANAVLNEIESIKSQVFWTQDSTPVTIIRLAKKAEYINDDIYDGTEYASVDFDASGGTTHTGSPSGISEFKIMLDMSFDIQQDQYDLLNYLESIKGNCINNSGNNYIRFCRHFDCRHEESRLMHDGPYTYMDFDGPQLTYPL